MSVSLVIVNVHTLVCNVNGGLHNRPSRVFSFLVSVPASHGRSAGSNPARSGANRTKGVILVP